MEVDKKITDYCDLGSKILLEETFYIFSKKNAVFRVQLSSAGLSLLKESNNVIKKQTILINDIIGCHCLRSKRRTKTASCVCHSLSRTPAAKAEGDDSLSEQDDTDFSAYLHIYAYILKSPKRGTKKRERTIITLRFRSFDKYEDNHSEAQRWRTVIKNLINGQSVVKSPSFTDIPTIVAEDDRKLLVFLNPKSGSGKARQLFQQRVVPILHEAEMLYDLYITKHANYAREFVRTHNIFLWKGIISVGGDGIGFEVVNGIMERPDWQEAFKKIPLGIIPCGSGNGLARSICHCYNEPYIPNPVQASTFAVVRKNQSSMDLVRVETKTEIMYSFLSIGWGLISDIDIESERLRAIGGQRFTIWSVARLIDLRTYKGKIWYLPADDNVQISTITKSYSKETDTDFVGDVNLETTEDDDSITFFECPNIGFDTRQRLDSWYSATSRRSAYFSATGSSYQSMVDAGSVENVNNGVRAHMYGPASQLPALTAPVPSHWTYKEGSFVMVHAAYQTHLGEDCFFVPNAKINDGIIWLLMLHAGLSRAQLLTFLLGLNSGTHIEPNNELIELVPVRAFRLVPDEEPNVVGYLTVDGEKVEYGPIQAEIFPGLANVMVP